MCQYLLDERRRLLRQLEKAEDSRNLDLWNLLWSEIAKIDRMLEVNP